MSADATIRIPVWSQCCHDHSGAASCGLCHDLGWIDWIPYTFGGETGAFRTVHHVSARVAIGWDLASSWGFGPPVQEVTSVWRLVLTDGLVDGDATVMDAILRGVALDRWQLRQLALVVHGVEVAP